jgi:DNA-directed RNA polymerase specialized sigma24 family protein
MDAGVDEKVDPLPVESAGFARKKWTLTQDAFDALLASLSPDRDTAADRYLEIRRNLVRLLEWRGSSMPDEDADETINRCAKRIADGDQIRDVATYCVGIARMVFREMSRERVRAARPLEEAPAPRVDAIEPESITQRRVECLRRCLGRLSPETRDLILHYYQGDRGDKVRNRNRLGQLLGISAGTLRMRALRVRERLQLCAGNCMQRQ